MKRVPFTTVSARNLLDRRGDSIGHEPQQAAVVYDIGPVGQNDAQELGSAFADT
jgi:hypothetical protein